MWPIATPTRSKTKNATAPSDFDRIGAEFHRWLRDAADLTKK
jgi:hypothetical protein